MSAGRCSSRFFNFPDEAKQPIKDGYRMRRTSRNKEVDRKNLVCAVKNFGMIAKRPAGNCTGSDRDNNLRLGHGLVGLLQSQAHVLSDGAGNQKSVRMAWRRHKLNAESARDRTPRYSEH